jgi:2'-5' RNA ligase
VGGDERLRLFLALRLPDETLEEVERWQREHLPRVRLVGREQLHVTLAFLGHRPADELEAIVAALADAARGVGEIRLTPVRYRETRSVGMLVLDDEAGRATALAADLHARLAALGIYEPERRPWLPHLTVARWRQRPRLEPELPRRTFVPSDAAAYVSRLHPGGARYAVLKSVALGG